MSRSGPSMFMDWFYGVGSPETSEEVAITSRFQRFVLAFFGILFVSGILSSVVRAKWYTARVMNQLGIVDVDVPGPGILPPDATVDPVVAWSVLSVPLWQLLSTGLLVGLVLARSYQVYSLSDEEIERIEQRSRTRLAPVVAGVGLLAVAMFLYYVPSGPEGPFDRRLLDLWGVTVYSAAGATGMLTGAFFTLSVRGTVVYGLVFGLCSLVLYPRTVLFLV